jgi:hypothetical protein
MLRSNSLFIDTEYKADCEHKINYLKLNGDFSGNLLSDSSEISENSLLEAFSDGVVNTTNEQYSFANDGIGYVYPVRKITANYSKIIVDYVQQ